MTFWCIFVMDESKLKLSLAPTRGNTGSPEAPH